MEARSLVIELPSSSQKVFINQVFYDILEEDYKNKGECVHEICHWIIDFMFIDFCP